MYSSFGKLLKIAAGFGNELVAPLVKTSYTYTNRKFDEETGLYYYRARYYDAHSGRFLQEDPYAGEKVNPSTFNTKFSYTRNNPANLVDPDGLFGIGRALTLATIIGITNPLNIAGMASDFWDKNRYKIIGGALFVTGAAITISSGGTASPLGGALMGAGVGFWTTDKNASMSEAFKNGVIGAGIGASVVAAPGGILAKAAVGAAVGFSSSIAFGETPEENQKRALQGAFAGGISGAGGGAPSGGDSGSSWSGGRLIPK